MPNTEIEFNPVDFITIGTVGPKGRRQFNLQAGKDKQVVTITIEKEQARQLSDAIHEILSELITLDKIDQKAKQINLNQWNMELRDPVEPLFRVAKMGLGYDESNEMIILVAQELLIPEEDEAVEELNPSIVRFWGTVEQYSALSDHTLRVVEQGRADPRKNGHVIYYWT